MLLDTASGAEQWRITDLNPARLTDDLVYGSVSAEFRGFLVETAVDRATGAPQDLPERVWIHGAGGPGAVVDRSNGTHLSGRLAVLGLRSTPEPIAPDWSSHAVADCAEAAGLVCTVSNSTTGTDLLTWFSGEAEPTTAPLWDGALEIGAPAGTDILLVNDDPYRHDENPDVRRTWFAVRRDGTVIGERRPGVVRAASERWVVTWNESGQAPGRVTQELQVWAVG